MKVEMTQHKIVALIDEGIVEFYYNMIPAHFIARRSLYRPHITIVRTGKEKCDFDVAQKFEGRAVKFEYDGIIKFDTPYFYLEVWSEEIGKIRQELGLPKFRNGFQCYHITIANVKE